MWIEFAGPTTPISPVFDWTPYLVAGIPGFIALLAVIIGKIFDVRQARQQNSNTNQARREPTWHELVEENRSLRADLTALDERFDEFKDAAETATKTLKGKVESLEIERKLSDRREVLLYRHTKALRDHIINELPPPPPAAPQELIDWFARFEDTDPRPLYP